MVDHRTRSIVADMFDAFLSGRVAGAEFVDSALIPAMRSEDLGLQEIANVYVEPVLDSEPYLQSDAQWDPSQKDELRRVFLFLRSSAGYGEWPPRGGLVGFAVAASALTIAILVCSVLSNGGKEAAAAFALSLFIGVIAAAWLIPRVFRLGFWTGAIRRDYETLWPFRTAEDLRRAEQKVAPDQLPELLRQVPSSADL